jgi:hypothetical protein
MKLTTGVNFINIFCVHFSSKSAFFHQNVTREKLHEAILYEKGAQKMLMKFFDEIDTSSTESKKQSNFTFEECQSKNQIKKEKNVYFLVYVRSEMIDKSFV